MTTREVLVKARALIADPKRWTKHEMARDAQGRAVAAVDCEACQWCAVGAIIAAFGAWNFSAENVLFEKGVQALGSRAQAITSFNDAPRTKHARVLAAFDKAIAECDRKEHRP